MSHLSSQSLWVEDAAREKGVRKVVRALIEARGGNGAEVKKDLDASYRKGVVFYRDVRVAEWVPAEGRMKLMGEACQLQAAYDILMGTK